LTSFFGKFRPRHNDAFRAAAVDLAAPRIRQEQIPQETLILDSTVCERCGRQEGVRQGSKLRKPGRSSHRPLQAALGSGHGVTL
jgi:hypothetical protein